MSIENYYIDCVRSRPTESLNDSLRPVTTYNSTAIKGYLGSGTDKVVKIADKDTIETRYKFYCNDFDILINDLILYENKTYEVTSEPKNTAHKNHHIKVLVRKVDEVKQQ